MEKQKKTRTMSPELLEKLAAARERAAALRAEQKAKKTNEPILKVVEPEPVKVVEPEPVKIVEPEPVKVVEPEPEKVKRTKKKVVVVASSDDDSSSEEEYVIKIPKKVIKAKKVVKKNDPIPIPVTIEPQEIKSPEPSSLPKPSFNKSQHLVNLARMGYSF